MIVIYKRRWHRVNIKYSVFVRLQEAIPELKVEIEHLTSSMYKEILTVSIGDLTIGCPTINNKSPP